MTRRLIWLISLVLIPLTGFSQTVWVSDEIQAPLRKSPSARGEIVSFIKAGQAAQKLAEKTDEEGTNYIQIKLKDGTIGWLTNYYILTNQSVHARLEPLEKELNEIKQENTELKAKISQLNQQVTSLSTGVSSAKTKLINAKNTEQQLDKLQSDYNMLREQAVNLKDALASAKKAVEKERLRYASLAKVSQDAVRIDNQNQQLQERAIQLEQSLQLVEGENETLRSRTSKNEWYTGASIALIGVFAGIILPALFRRRRHYR